MTWRDVAYDHIVIYVPVVAKIKIKKKNRYFILKNVKDNKIMKWNEKHSHRSLGYKKR